MISSQIITKPLDKDYHLYGKSLFGCRQTHSSVRSIHTCPSHKPKLHEFQCFAGECHDFGRLVNGLVHRYAVRRQQCGFISLILIDKLLQRRSNFWQFILANDIRPLRSGKWFELRPGTEPNPLHQRKKVKLGMWITFVYNMAHHLNINSNPLDSWPFSLSFSLMLTLYTPIIIHYEEFI